jgi:hypothetical protein
MVEGHLTNRLQVIRNEGIINNNNNNEDPNFDCKLDIITAGARIAIDSNIRRGSFSSLSS